MRLLWCISCKLLEFLSSRVSYCTIFFSTPHFPTAAPPPIQGMSGDLSASVAPRGGAFVLANMTNPHLDPPSPVGGVVGHNIDRRITIPATAMAAIRVSYASLSLSADRGILVNSRIYWVTF